jgi:hypothetical protein
MGLDVPRIEGPEPTMDTAAIALVPTARRGRDTGGKSRGERFSCSYYI